MSVSFSIVGSHDYDASHDEDDDLPTVNISNANARGVLNALGAPGADEDQPCGSLPAPELARLCMRVVNSVADVGQDGFVEKQPGRATLVTCGRRPGYVQEVALRLWHMALAAPPGAKVSWG